MPDSVCDLDETLDLVYLSPTKGNSQVEIQRFQLLRLHDLDWIKLGLDYYGNKSHSTAFLHAWQEKDGKCTFELTTEYSRARLGGENN